MQLIFKKAFVCFYLSAVYNCYRVPEKNLRASYDQTPAVYHRNRLLLRYAPGTKATITCFHDHILDGPNEATCQDTGEWTQLPTCNLSNKYS